jgi:hypothetical protein
MLDSESSTDERREAAGVAIERPDEMERLLRCVGASTGSSSEPSEPNISSASDAESSSEPGLRERTRATGGVSEVARPKKKATQH